QPDVLADLFAALGGDPFLVAECLARPVLADRLVRNWYAHDDRFHGLQKEDAEQAYSLVKTAAQMKNAGGTYSEITWERDDDPAVEQGIRADHGAMLLDSDQWLHLQQTLVV